MSLFRLHSEPEARIREDFDREAWPPFREIYRAACRGAMGIAGGCGAEKPEARPRFLSRSHSVDGRSVRTAI